MFYSKADTKQWNRNYALIFNSITVRYRTLNKWRCFKHFTNTSISGPLFTHLWTLTTDFVLIQVNAGSDLHIFKFILPSLYESRLILLIYKKYGKSFVEIIPVQACYGRIPWNEFLIKFRGSHYLIILFFWCNLQWKLRYIFLTKACCLPETWSFV